MAPAILSPRQYYRCDGYRNCSNPWYDYGRWVVLAGIILGAFLLFFLFACITARRRRRRGMQPFRGTGWAAGQPPPGHGVAQYTGAPQPYYASGQQAPPVYSPPGQTQGYGNNQNHYGGANQGYFGGQQTGAELQQPDHAYHPQNGGPGVYAPPAEAPPGKK